jgi:hypothetical protein
VGRRRPGGPAADNRHVDSLHTVSRDRVSIKRPEAGREPLVGSTDTRTRRMSVHDRTDV